MNGTNKFIHPKHKSYYNFDGVIHNLQLEEANAKKLMNLFRKHDKRDDLFSVLLIPFIIIFSFTNIL